MFSQTFRIFIATITSTALLAVSIFPLSVRAASPPAILGPNSALSDERASGCASCATSRQQNAPDEQALNALDQLASLGRRAQIFPFIPVTRSTLDGVRVNLVSTARGDLSFAVTDLNLSGALPLVFQRVYDSDRNEDRGLGRG